jgi:hypothetical protein
MRNIIEVGHYSYLQLAYIDINDNELRYNDIYMIATTLSAMISKLIGRREFSLLNSEYEEITDIEDEMRKYIDTNQIPLDCKVNVYRDQVTCCGIFTMGIAFEYECPDENILKELDLMIYSKILEICERQNIVHHEPSSLNIL